MIETIGISKEFAERMNSHLKEMPIASFLEEYDLSGKQIIPFCSHGGGRFGQSLTAIAKLAPNADLGEGLSVHYSGGSGLAENVKVWLEKSGILNTIE